MTVKYLQKFVKDPLFAFIIISAAIFSVYYLLEDNNHPRLNLSPEMRAELIEEYQAISGLKASSEVISRLEKNYITDEILFRSAVNSGMHLIDPATRSSLVEKMRFRISALIPEPTEVELVKYYAQNMQAYYTETSFSFTHLYFKDLPVYSSNTTSNNASNMLLKLNSGEAVQGEIFLHGNEFLVISEGMLRGILGEEFLLAISSANIDRWEGPFASNYGFHYVKLLAKTPPQPMPFSLARNIIANDLMQLETDKAVGLKVQSLVREYDINIEP
jgi:hypothetical protein